MALTARNFVQPLGADHTNLAKIVVVDLTFDADYEDGGSAFVKEALSLSEVWFCVVDQNNAADAETAYHFQYNYAADTIQAFVSDDADADDEIAASTGSSVVEDVTIRVFAYGLGA